MSLRLAPLQRSAGQSHPSPGGLVGLRPPSSRDKVFRPLFCASGVNVFFRFTCKVLKARGPHLMDPRLVLRFEPSGGRSQPHTRQGSCSFVDFPWIRVPLFKFAILNADSEYIGALKSKRTTHRVPTLWHFLFETPESQRRTVDLFTLNSERNRHLNKHSFQSRSH